MGQALSTNVLGGLAAMSVGLAYSAWYVLAPSSSRPPHPLVERRKHKAHLAGVADTATLRQRFKLKELPTRPDAIVIGSGPGGLTTAALLAKQGKCVVVLEQHDRAGGGMHSFEDKGYEWDTGFHYIGEMQSDSPLRGIVNYLTGDKVEWAWMGDNKHSKGAYDTAIFGDERHDILAGRENFKQVLLAACPEEKEAIEGIMGEIEKVTKEQAFTKTLIWKTLPSPLRSLLHRVLRKPFLDLSSQSTLEVLKRYTDNEKLIGLFTYIWGCYASPPSDSSWGVHAMVTAHYFNGACFPVGGPSELVRGFIDTIEASGGRVLVNAPVEQILTNAAGDRAIGVRMANKNGDEILAPTVISSIGVRHTFGKLTTPVVAARCGWEKKALADVTSRDVKPGRGHVTLFCGFTVDGDEAKLPSANTWIFPENHNHDQNTKQFLRRQVVDGEVTFPGMEEFLEGGETYPYMCLAFPSEKDPAFRKRFPRKCTASLMLEVDPEMFMENKRAATAKTHKRGELHNSLKERFAERLMDVLFKHYPQLEGHLDVYEVGTPLCANYYLGKLYGSSYGCEYTPEFFKTQDEQIDPQTPVTGLYLAGQDVSVCGFSGAMVSGIYCASRIISPWRMWYGLMGAMGISTVINPAADMSPSYSKYLPKFNKSQVQQPQEKRFDPRYLAVACDAVGTTEQKSGSEEPSFYEKMRALERAALDEVPRIDTLFSTIHKRKTSSASCSSDEEKCATLDSATSPN